MSDTVCGLLPASSITSKVAVRVPVLKGENVMLMVQLAPGAIEPRQELDCAYSLLKLPERTMLLMTEDADPPLATVTDCEALAVPMPWELKIRIAGEGLSG